MVFLILIKVNLQIIKWKTFVLIPLKILSQAAFNIYTVLWKTLP